MKKTRKQKCCVLLRYHWNSNIVTMVLVEREAGYSESWTLYLHKEGLLPSDFGYLGEWISKWAFENTVNWKESWVEPQQTLPQGMVALSMIVIVGYCSLT